LSMYAQWWQFVLAIQIFYSFLPRGLLLICARVLYLRRIARLEQSLQVDLNGQNIQQDQQDVLAPVVTEIETNCTLINWGDIPETIVDEVLTRFQPGVSGRLFAGPTAEEAEQLIAQQSEGNQLVLLRSWEPPMAELADYLREGFGYLLPLDWKDSGLETIESYHLQEWRRFAATQEKWQLLIWPEQGK
jgi:hypothetical protein